MEAGAHEGGTFFELLRFCRAAAATQAAASSSSAEAAAEAAAAAAAAEGLVTVEEGLWAVAVGVAAQRSIATGSQPVLVRNLLAAGPRSAGLPPSD
jgi:hypothetical protein